MLNLDTKAEIYTKVQKHALTMEYLDISPSRLGSVLADLDNGVSTVIMQFKMLPLISFKPGIMSNRVTNA